MSKKNVSVICSTKYFLDDGKDDAGGTSINTLSGLRTLLYSESAPVSGSQLMEAALGMRLAFLMGDGIQVTSENNAFNNWVKSYIKEQELDGIKLLQFCEQLETRGYVGCNIDTSGGIKLKDVVKENVPSIHVLLSTYRSAVNQRTRLSLLVNICKRYEEKLQKISTLNDKATNITPVIKVNNVSDVQGLKTKLESEGWKLGEALIGADDLEYKSPKTDAVQSLINELVVLMKHASALVGVPVHWFGWVDLTGNKAVAETTYDIAVAATVRERIVLTSFVRRIIKQALEIYINSGKAGDLKELENSFDVSIPMFSQNKFKSIVDSLSKAFNDGVVSVDEYRTNIPVIDASSDNYNEQKELGRVSNIVVDNIISKEEENEG